MYLIMPDYILANPNLNTDEKLLCMYIYTFGNINGLSYSNNKYSLALGISAKKIPNMLKNLQRNKMVIISGNKINIDLYSAKRFEKMTHYYMDLVDANGDIHDGEIILQQLADEAIQGD